MTDLSPEARELLAAAAGQDDPSRADRERVRRAVMLAVVAGAGASSLASAASAKAATTALTATEAVTGALAAKTAASTVAGLGAGAAGATAATGGAGLLGVGGVKIAGWLLLGGALGLAVAAPAMQARSPAGGDAPSPARALEPSSAARVHLAAEPARGEATSRGAAVASPPARASVGASPAAPTAAARPATRVTGPRAAGARPAPAAPPSTLADESALLAGAQRELGAGDPAAALARLGEHERRFPTGALTPERSAAKIFALCAAGRESEARALRAAFLAEHPGSPLAPRVSAACAR